MTSLEHCDEFVGTCDAGRCDLPTVAVVWTGEEWLSCCRTHARQEIAWAEPDPCLQCEAGRCGNCEGRTWGRDAVDYTACPCAGAGHG